MESILIRVLLVEDNPVDARLVDLMLTEAGAGRFKVERAERLAQALDLLHERDFDVTLLDLSLPPAQGLATLHELRRVAPDLPIVVLSGLDDEVLALQAVHDGAQDYLVKGRGDGEVLTRALRYAIERKRSELHLAYLAQYDPLTDLPNRFLFRDRLARALKRAHRRSRGVILMYLDLDHFKEINDTLGHAAGDQLLHAVAERLKRCVRQEDTIARLGGDEFTIILEDVDKKAEAGAVAQKVLDALAAPCVIDGNDVFINASVGIAMYPDSGDDEDVLIRHADMALYAAKERGRGGYRFFEPRMSRAATRRMKTVARLQHALDRNEFELHYQPQFDLRRQTVVGVEALLRWRDADDNLVPPAQFVHLLEETGLIIPVGEWVLRRACAQHRAWRDQGLPPLRMAVNLSARQFRKTTLVHTVDQVLAETGMAPELLQLEVSENLLLADRGDTMATFRALTAAGACVSIDDFGTGYSSLNYLRYFPFAALNVDRTFIKDITAHADGRNVVAAVIALAHSLHLRVVAEGVENQSQLEALIDAGCDEAQGYLLCPAMAAAPCTQWLGAHFEGADAAALAAI